MYQISPNVTESYKISPYLTELHQTSPKLNVGVGLHAGQYYGGDMTVFIEKNTLHVYYRFIYNLVLIWGLLSGLPYRNRPRKATLAEA